MTLAYSAIEELGLEIRANQQNPSKMPDGTWNPVVKADIDDVESLKKAFAGAYGVYGVTNFWEHFSGEKEKTQAKNIADAANPNHTETTLMPVDTDIANTGRGVSMMAVAAGVTISAKSNSVPTAWTAIVTAKPKSAMKIIDSARTGRPLASATGALTEQKRSGR